MTASRSSLLSLALAAVVAVPGFFVSGSALAQDLCADNGALMQGARQAQAERAKEIEKHARDVYGPMAKSPDWVSDANSPLANCVADKFQGFKSGNALFDKYATVAVEAAIDKACAEQRKRISQVTSQGSGYLSRVPGFQNIGSVPINYPVSGGTPTINYDDIIRQIGDKINQPSTPKVPTPTQPSTPSVPGVSKPGDRVGGGVPGVVQIQ